MSRAKSVWALWGDGGAQPGALPAGGAARELGLRHCWLEVQAWKLHCGACGRQSRQRLPGILRCQWASESFQQAIYRQHLDGVNRSRLGRREGIGAATVDRYFRRGLQLQFREWHPPRCPPVMGIDEHFFTRRQGYATTICDLRKRKVYDVRLGRSEAALEPWLRRLEGKEEVRLVCMDRPAPTARWCASTSPTPASWPIAFT